MIRFKMILLIPCLALQALFAYSQEEKTVVPAAQRAPAAATEKKQILSENAEMEIAKEREAVFSNALKKAQPLFGDFKTYVKRTPSTLIIYLTEEDRNAGANPIVSFQKESLGYKTLADNSEFGPMTFVNGNTGDDVDYKTLTTDLVELGKILSDEQRIEESSQIVDRFINEYKANIKDISSNYQTEYESVKVYGYAYDIKSRIAHYLEDMARKAYADKKYDKAILLANGAQKMISNSLNQMKTFMNELKTDPQDGKTLEDRIRQAGRMTEMLQSFEENCKKQIASDKFIKDTDFAAFDPERPLRQSDIEVSLAQAVVLIKNEEYVRARDALEKVLVRDPYNQKGTRMLQIVYDKLYQVAKMRRFNEEQEIIAENRWNWNEAVLPTPAIKPAQGANAAALVKSELSDKLSEIIIDQIDFEDATITSVVNLLIQRSKELDPSANKTGVNILLRLTPEEVMSAPKITMSLDGIPLGEVIRYICQACVLKYRVEERAVIISSEITDIMETRFFKVRAALINNIVPGALAEKDDTGFEAGGGGIDLAGNLKADAKGEAKTPLSSQALKDYFSQRGVNFLDPNTAIAFDRRGGKLVVKNTPENLRRLEALLRDLDIETPLVLIESKFIELTQDDTEELGFEWMINKTTNGQPGAAGGDWTTFSSGGVIPGVTGPNGVPVPSSTPSSSLMGPSVPGSTIVNNLRLPGSSAFPGFGRKNQFYLDVIVHAMDRSGKAEILSAPKVIATSGQPALIRMVREQYFPSSWTEPEITIGDNVVQITPSYPELGEATDLGIRLEVTATVSPNNYTISLNLHPQVREQIDWTNYGYNISVFDGVTTMLIPATLKMPVLSLRDVTTNVKVYDGETLILGGMIRDNVGGIDDRIPGLGDLPLIGRLWRTKNEISSKKNLLIFVTARLVNPDGIPVRMGETRGLPDFRR